MYAVPVTLHFALAPSAGFDSQVEWSGNPRRSPFDRADIPGGVSLGIFQEINGFKWIFSVANHDVTSTVSTDPIVV